MKKIRQKSLNYNNISEIQYQKTVLDNGLRIITEKVPGVHSFSLGVCVDAGSRDEDPALPGIAHFMEHMAFRRTKTRTAKQIASQFESLGAYSNAFTTKETTCFYVRALEPHLAKTLELLADIVVNQIFVEKDFEKERSIIAEEIKSYEDDPEEFAFDCGDMVVFPDSQLGAPIVGNSTSIEKMTVADLQSFRDKFYVPQNMIVSAAGAIDHDLIVKLCKEYFAEFKPREFNYTRMAPINNKTTEKIVPRPIQQAHLLLGKQISGITSPERYPLAVLNSIFGDGMSSRIYQRLREKHGAAYSVYSTLQTYSDCGALFVYIAADKKNVAKAEKYLFEEMYKIADGKITTSEFKRAKEQLKSGAIIELEGMSARMQAMCKNEFHFGTYESVEKTVQAIDAVTIDSVRELAGKYFASGNWSKTLLNPEEEETPE